MKESGLMLKWKRKYVPDENECTLQSKQAHTSNVFRLKMLQQPLSVCVFGLILSMVVLILEVVIGHRCKKWNELTKAGNHSVIGCVCRFILPIVTQSRNDISMMSPKSQGFLKS